jgi:hypothetical protein
VLALAAPLHVHDQVEPVAQIGHVATIAQQGRRQLGLGVAHAPQRALDPGALLLDERLDVAQREAPRHHHLDPVAVDQDAGVARPL